MKIKSIIYFITATTLVMSCNSNKTNMSQNNPLLKPFETPHGVPPFDQIKIEHYLPAFEQGMLEQNKNIETIINNTAAPDFTNTIEAFENSGKLLGRVGDIFYNLLDANTNDSMFALSNQLAPLLTEHGNNIMLNKALFQKVSEVYNKRESLVLSVEQNTLLEKTYRDFVRGGANIPDDKTAEFREINNQLAMLYLNYGDNLLNENNRFKKLITDKSELSGLSENAILTAAQTATENGFDGQYMFTIHKPSLLPVLENADNRQLRKEMFEAYMMKSNYNDSLDNKAIINKIVNLRLRKAQLLGYPNFAEYVLDKNMAKKSENVFGLLDQLMPSALLLAKEEVADMQKMINKSGQSFKLEAYDYAYYATKVREQKFAINENQVRPYMKLENVRDGMFWVATQLYGITFKPLTDVPVYHPDVEVFEVFDTTNLQLGILYLDYFPRASKRSGAWCTGYRAQTYENGKRVNPVVSIVCNFSAPVGDTPALLSADETETLFHEFGHALDGLFVNKQYTSLGVPRDFVELPSQIMENWAFAPEVLNQYAKHYQTGEVIPAELVDKIEKAGKFNQGFATTEYLAASYLDMYWHTISDTATFDVEKFEAEAMAKIGLINEIIPRYRSTYFQHIFSGEGYASGYYSYLWAEVLDADAFEAFKQNGLFDKATALAFRKNVLEQGGTKDAMELYIQFRGSKPGIEPLKARRGLK